MTTFSKRRTTTSRRLSALCFALACCIGAGAGEFDPWTQTATYELRYRVDLERFASVKSGSARVWIPTPADHEHQRVISTAVDSPWKYRTTRDERGNCFIYLEPGGAIGGKEIVMRFVVERSPYTGAPKSAAKPNSPLDPRRYLQAQSHIPIDGKLKLIADAAGGDRKTDGERIRAYYDYVTGVMKYSKQGDGWGRGDAVWACDSKYGNCTDFHSVIIGMCRSEGVPARFVIGFPIPPDKVEADIKGYHCWAEAYDRERGWLPMDASEAWKAKRFDDYYGKLPSDRVEFTVGRDLVLTPPQSGPPLNYFIYPYVEVDGKPAGKVTWTLHARRIAARGVDGGEDD